jgi:parallel beta-helix repeat protein
MAKKIAIMAIVIIFANLLSFACTNSEAFVQASVNTPSAGALVVPDQYPTIQAAVGNASAGDTVFVKKGTYFVNGLEINKPLKLIGEETEKTIVDAKANVNSGQETVIISSSNVLITGFTFIDSHEAIVVRSSNLISGITINDNSLVNNSFGIISEQNSAVNIVENKISNNQQGVNIGSFNTIVLGNTISRNYYGIVAFGADNLTIANNNIVNNSYGIYLGSVSSVNINSNNITGSTGYDNVENRYEFGLGFRENCNNTLIQENNIQGNSIGVSLQNVLLTGTTPSVRISQGSGNIIYNNNFINNTISNVKVEKSYPYIAIGIVNGTAIVSWDNGTVGNYWSDYQTIYPNATEIDASGTGDTAYVIDESNADYHPLINQINEVIPSSTFSSVLLLSIAIIVVILVFVISCIIILKKKKYM